MADIGLSLEDELSFLHSLTQSTGWKLYYEHNSRVLKACALSLRSQENDKRDWMAGLVTGYERMLNYPTTRIGTIEKELVKQAKR